MIYICGGIVAVVIVIIGWSILRSGADADKLTARILENMRNEKNSDHTPR